MFGLLVDMGWVRERWGMEPRDEKRRRLPKYLICIAVCSVLIIAGVLLATAESGSGSDPHPVKARMRLM